jgi:hypothetical protein
VRCLRQVTQAILLCSTQESEARMGESSKSASTPMGAVLLSYASQDGEAAKRICEALRAAGIEVWFD